MSAFCQDGGFSNLLLSSLQRKAFWGREAPRPQKSLHGVHSVLLVARSEPIVVRRQLELMVSTGEGQVRPITTGHK